MRWIVAERPERAVRSERNGQRHRWTTMILAPVRPVLSVWSDLVAVGSWSVRHWPF